MVGKQQPQHEQHINMFSDDPYPVPKGQPRFQGDSGSSAAINRNQGKIVTGPGYDKVFGGAKKVTYLKSKLISLLKKKNLVT